MIPSLALAAALLAPAQDPAAKLDLTNVRRTFGFLGSTRPPGKLLPGDLLVVAYDIEGIRVGKEGEARYTMTQEVVDKAGKSWLKRDPKEERNLVPLGGNRLPARAFVTLGLDLPPGEYTMKLGVTDDATKAMKSLEYKFEVDQPGFGLVDVTTSVDARGAIPAANVGVVGSAVHVQFATVGFKRDANRRNWPDLLFEMTVLDDAGKPTLPAPTGHKVTSLEEREEKYQLEFPLPMTRPGKYTVRLAGTDKVANKTATVDLPLTVLPADK